MSDVQKDWKESPEHLAYMFDQKWVRVPCWYWSLEPQPNVSCFSAEVFEVPMIAGTSSSCLLSSSSFTVRLGLQVVLSSTLRVSPFLLVFKLA